MTALKGQFLKWEMTNSLRCRVCKENKIRDFFFDEEYINIHSIAIDNYQD